MHDTTHAMTHDTMHEMTHEMTTVTAIG